MYPSDGNSDFEYEYTPLHYVAAKGMHSLIKELIEYEKIPVDIQTQNYKNTALHLASSRGHLYVVEFLLEKGADSKLLDHRGGSVLHYAATGDNGEMERDIIHCLIEKGANFKKIVCSGSSMLDTVVIFCNTPVIEYWEDVYEKNPDSDVDVMTKGTLAFAKYRYKKHPEERGFQKDIIKILKRVMQSRQEKKQAGSAGK